MTSEYRIYQEKWLRFNQWENLQRKKLKPYDTLHQFFTLFDLTNYFPDELQKKYHQEHLRALIEIQRILRNAKPTTDSTDYHR